MRTKPNYKPFASPFIPVLFDPAIREGTADATEIRCFSFERKPAFIVKTEDPLPKEEDLVRSTVGEMIQVDPSTITALGIFPNWYARRRNRNAPWIFFSDSPHWQIPEQGYELVFEKDPSFAHQYCGPHDIPGAHCSNCGRKLHRILTLDKSDSRINLEGFPAPLIHLLYCWECGFPDPKLVDKPQGKLIYQIRDDQRVYPIHVQSIKPPLLETGPFPEYFPGRPVSLSPVTETMQEMANRILQEIVGFFDTGLKQRSNLFVHPKNQVGGGLCFQGLKPAEICPYCYRGLLFLATLNCEHPDGTPMSQCRSQQLVFMVCEEDGVIVAFEDCDPGVPQNPNNYWTP